MLFWKRNKLGPILNHWTSLIREGRVVENASQIRAACKLDEFYECVFPHLNRGQMGDREKNSHISSSACLGSEDRMNVARYTRRLSQENKMLLGKKLVVEEVPTPKIVVNESKLEEKISSPECLSMYLFGSFGRGKTMLMNILFSELKEDRIRVRRFHFFELMKFVHANGIRHAEKLGDSYDVICIDEIAITDVQDASLFPRLLTALLRQNTLLVMTSNQHPKDLYAQGLNRHIFMPPLLHQIKGSFRIISLNDEASIDFRTVSLERKNWIHKTSFPHFFGEKLALKIPLSPSRSITLAVKAGTRTVSFKTEDIEMSEGDYVVFLEYLSLHKMDIELHISGKFKPVDILFAARRFTKFIEAIYDREEIGLTIISASKPSGVFDLILQDIEFFSPNSETPLYCPQSSIQEALLSISRCKSRLDQCIFSSSYKLFLLAKKIFFSSSVQCQTGNQFFLEDSCLPLPLIRAWSCFRSFVWSLCFT